MIISQSYRPLELIIIDDGSTDSTLEAIKTESVRLRSAGIETVIRTIPHSGQDAALNKGLEYVSGDYLFWCDDDDELTQDSISSKVEWLKCNPRYGFVRSDALYIEEATGKVLRHAYRDVGLKGCDILKNLLNDTMPCLAGTYLMRTSLLDRIYPDRRIPLNGEGQNLQLLIPSAMISKCGFIDKVQLRYFIHPDSHSSKGRSLTDLLARNERFRELKLALIGKDKKDLAEIINMTHDRTRRNIMSSAVKTALNSTQNNVKH